MFFFFLNPVLSIFVIYSHRCISYLWPCNKLPQNSELEMIFSYYLTVFYRLKVWIQTYVGSL